MPRKLRQVKNNFSAGELDPRLHLRSDVRAYQNGAKQMRNVLLLTQGGFVRRPGMEYVANTTTNQEGRLVRFEFNTEQTYLLVFTPGEMKVYREVSGVPTLQTTVSSSPISSLTAAQISEATFTQSADTLLIFHEDVQTIKVTRTGHTSWTATAVTYENIPVFPFSGVTVTNPATTLNPTGTAGTINMTTGGLSVFTAAHLGQYININDGLVFITEIVSGTTVRGLVRSELSGSSAAAIGTWSLETGYEEVISATRGWPRSGVFFAGRLWLGGLKSRPQTLLASNIGDFFNFDLGSVRDDQAIDATIDDDRVNAILHIFPGRNLQIFTTGGEFFVPQNNLNSITPSNIVIQKATLHGSADIKPVSVDGATIFVERRGKVVRSFVYDEVEASYVASNASLLSSHLIRNPVRMDLRRTTSDDDSNYVFIVNEDGTLAALNTLREQDINGISLIETEGEIEDVCVVDDTVYFIVKRTINSNTVRFIERFNDSHVLDASTLKTGSSALVWSGFDHLDGEDCKVIRDDYVEPYSLTPSSGSITLENEGETVELGLNYLYTVEPLAVEAALPYGSTSRAFRRIVKAIVEVYETRDMTVNGYEPSLYRFDSSTFDAEASSLENTGTYIMALSGWDREESVILSQTEPTRVTVLGITFEVAY